MPLSEKGRIELDKLPKAMQEQVKIKIDSYSEKVELLGLEIPDNKEFLLSISKVWACSLFISENCIKTPEMLHGLVSTGDLFATDRRQHYVDYLQNTSIDSDKHLQQVLRLFRCREMVRIAWRDLAGWSKLDETLQDLTKLAEICIQFTLDYFYQQACNRRGIPTTEDGTPINIVILGMGKLGAWELNYSSDIDLIFAYAEDGVLSDRKETSYGEFFSRICRSLVKTLDEITADGFVFRTDIRLRPFGDSGPIIMTFDGMENYYLTQAREWERYAMIKARQVAGDFDSGKQLAAMIKSFVYRRYLDYGAFEELRSLKIQITQQLMRKDRMENIKLGPGGIREIEFIGQAFQLIRGGQVPELQERSILKILKMLGEMELLTQKDAEQLQRSYCFLRRAENHIQQYQDKQTHDLPKDPLVQQILAFSMDFSDWNSFKTKLDQVRDDVQSVFDQVFSLSEQQEIKQTAEIVWSGDKDEESFNYLIEHGFEQANSSLKILNEFKKSRAINRLSTKGLGVIDRLIPQLIDGLQQVDNPDITLKRVLDLIEAVAGRNVYLSLLSENPSALDQLLKLSSESLWICEYLAQYPMLFDELLDTRSLYDPLNKQQLAAQLNRCLDHVADNDIEHMMIKLRQFKQINILRIAAADIMGVIPVMVVSDYLTYVAEVILESVVDKSWKILTEKHGWPPNIQQKQQGFAILGFGKLGGLELGYGSDLDMVFIYDCADGNALTDGNKAISCAQFYGRIGQKVRHILDTKMLSGRLYEVDMRLRPSGDSGLLVAQINSYEDYLKNNAWTWEHQALVRGRFVAGDHVLKQQYEAIRQRILGIKRDSETLKIEVREMRDKMREALTAKENETFDLKQSIGGIVDIEFIVQFHILAHASEKDGLTTYTDNIRLLDALNQHGLISTEQIEILKNAYCEYRDYGHHQVLQGKRAMARKDEFVEIRAQVENIWHEYMSATN
ncbi:MAG: bifunctional [glutamate--ammonia ligase]-adenylyl-L-tyrosine phosphorylase/[glutamate--ammonia-ligase] adenylyltransferase [Methylococcaceae bacterium]|nr:bifunctional [glutamate--ammonia ligase]-adenylyl-L-tyrosine phosphorylase/[glutamate--ammonia-ligase] adenylyltransferase [Methylococcaceae bacterium]